MSIVTISRGSYTKGKQVAERLGEKLGYRVVSREILLKTSTEFNIPEIKLKNSLYNAPSILSRFFYGKERYLSFIRAKILEHMAEDNTIYHGIGGHAFMENIGHELNVRIRANFEDRIKRYIEYIKKEQGKDITEKEARFSLSKDDEERHKWSIHITGVDPCDAGHYDVVYNASKIEVEDIVDSIIQLLQLPYLQTTEESQYKIEQLALAAKVKSAIVYDYPSAEVSSWDNIAHVKVNSELSQEEKIINKVKQKAIQVQGIKDVKVYVTPHSNFE